MPQALSTVPAGTVVTLHHKDKQISVKAIGECRYRVSYTIGGTDRVRLIPLVWVQDEWHVSSLRQPFFRSADTLVEIDQ